MSIGSKFQKILNKVKVILLIVVVYILLGTLYPSLDYLYKNYKYGPGIEKMHFLTAAYIPVISLANPKYVLTWPYWVYQDVLSERNFVNKCLSFNNSVFNSKKLENYGATSVRSETGNVIRIARDCCTNQGLICKVLIDKDLYSKSEVVYDDPIID